MEFCRLSSPSQKLYEKAMALYQNSFPFHEQRESASQVRILQSPFYHFELLCEGDEWLGLMLYWETDTFLYVEHFCMLPQVRGKGYGQKALQLLAARGKTVILEIDPPIDPVALRRKGFYERCGYVANRFAHVHPAYHAGYEGHKLVIMSYPDPLTEETYHAFACYLQDVVMEGASTSR